jgi:hypothetical protein
VITASSNLPCIHATSIRVGLTSIYLAYRSAPLQ